MERVLFVCSQNKLRSPTAEEVLRPFNVTKALAELVLLRRHRRRDLRGQMTKGRFRGPIHGNGWLVITHAVKSPCRVTCSGASWT